MSPPPDLTLAEQITLLSGSDFWHTAGLPDHGIAPVLLSDGPHGLRAQPDGSDHLGLQGSLPATCFPTAVTLGSSWDEDLLTEIGSALGREAAAQGVGVVLGPGLNIKRHPRCGRNFEYFSEDPLLSGRLAAAMVTGVQRQGVGACLKHFAVNNQETMRFVVDAIVDDRTLRELYLAGFEHAVRESDPWIVMAAYNLVNGVYCTENHRLLTTVLRDEWGFDGLVVSDWGASNDRVAGVYAGMDLEMPGSAGINDSLLADAVDSGDLAADAVRRSADRILTLTHRVSDPVGPPFDESEHDDLARRAAAAGSVLLTNDGILPLSPDQRITVIGGFARSPRFQGTGSSQVNPTRITSALDAFAAAGVDVRFAAGFDTVTSAVDPEAVAEAVEAAAEADAVVVMVGLPAIYESEGFDRPDLDLPPQQVDLIDAVCRVNPRTIVVLSNGAPIVMPWVDRPAAILEAYLGGQASGAAVVDMLLGAVEPGGRLAESFPVRASDVASDPWFPGEPHQVTYREGLFVGYRHHTTAGIRPLFPFGHGLGYTTIDIEEAVVDRGTISAGGGISIAVRVRNTGSRPGSEVVQVYLHDRTGVILRPHRELVGFRKVHLEPGEAMTVTVGVPARAFAFWDVRTQSWAMPSGPFDVEIGRSSEDIAVTSIVTVTGGVTDSAEPPDEPPITATDGQFAHRLGRPIPRPRPVRPFTRLSTVGEIQQTRLGRGIRSVLQRFSGADFDELATTEPALGKMFERGLDEMPLRTTALFSQGLITWPMLDDVIALLNADPRGLAAVPRGLLNSARRVLRR